MQAELIAQPTRPIISPYEECQFPQYSYERNPFSRSEVTRRHGRLDLLNHMHRDRFLAMLVGGELQVNEKCLEYLGVAAALHDIGKDVQPELFYDTGKFTSLEQRRLAAYHPYHGVMMLLNNPAMYGVDRRIVNEVAVIIMNHHAHFANSRQRCVDTALALGMKINSWLIDTLTQAVNILKLVDYVDARVVERPYHRSESGLLTVTESDEMLTVPGAYHFMWLTLGKQFCPEVYQAMMRVNYWVNEYYLALGFEQATGVEIELVGEVSK